MRSVKLLVSAAAVAALVAGPVLAQTADNSSAMTPATNSSSTAKPHKHSTKHKHSKHKTSSSSSSSTSSMPATTPAQ